MTTTVWFVSTAIFIALVLVSETHGQAVIQCAGFFPLTGKDARQGGIEEAVARKGLERANLLDDELNLNDTLIFELRTSDTESSISAALQAVNTAPLSALIFTSHDCVVAEALAPLLALDRGTHYTTCPSEYMKAFPNVVQMVPSERHQGEALADLIHHFFPEFAVGVLSSSSRYGAEVLGEFVKRLFILGTHLASSQQFYPGTQELWQVV